MPIWGNFPVALARLGTFLLGLLDGLYTNQSIPVSRFRLYVGMKKEGRVLVGPPFVVLSP